MKERNVLNVLIYLLQSHLKESCELKDKSDNITHYLEEAGFTPAAIDEAMHWLETLIVKEDAELISAPQTTSTRVFSPEEKSYLHLSCISFVTSLEQRGILTPENREIVIGQALALKSEFIDVNLIRWITLMVLFNQQDCENALACMEYFVLDRSIGEVH